MERLQRKVLQEVRQETIDTVVALMQQRFEGDVPGDLRERLRTCTQEDLRGVLLRIATAASALA